MENEILREAVEYGRAKKWIARSPSLPGGRPVKQVCEVLGVARSNVAAMRTRPADWRDGRTARQTDDAGLMDEIRHVIAELWLPARLGPIVARTRESMRSTHQCQAGLSGHARARSAA
nr:transposase [Ralstonia solanacearum]CUV38247.1 transposase [Ralstonia solanacearum]CUV62061.1 transposase [Ralstonia solanacearum]